MTNLRLIGSFSMLPLFALGSLGGGNLHTRGGEDSKANRAYLTHSVRDQVQLNLGIIEETERMQDFLMAISTSYASFYFISFFIALYTMYILLLMFCFSCGWSFGSGSCSAM